MEDLPMNKSFKDEKELISQLKPNKQASTDNIVKPVSAAAPAKDNELKP